MLTGEHVAVFDDVIEDVLVFVLSIVFVKKAEFDDDAEPVGVFDICPDLVKETDELDVLEVF